MQRRLGEVAEYLIEQGHLPVTRHPGTAVNQESWRG
jgi:hypothetical protein